MDNSRKIYVPPQGPPQRNFINPAIYAQMGEENVFAMLADFYGKLEKSSIRHLFPEDMKEASKKSAAFFVFLVGGPPLYQQKIGSPMMRQRHLPFEIDEEARRVWLECFKETLEDADVKYHFPKEHIKGFWDFLESFSGWMVNTKRDAG